MNVASASQYGTPAHLPTCQTVFAKGALLPEVAIATACLRERGGEEGNVAGRAGGIFSRRYVPFSFLIRFSVFFLPLFS